MSTTKIIFTLVCMFTYFHIFNCQYTGEAAAYCKHFGGTRKHPKGEVTYDEYSYSYAARFYDMKGQTNEEGWVAYGFSNTTDPVTKNLMNVTLLVAYRNLEFGKAYSLPDASDWTTLSSIEEEFLYLNITTFSSIEYFPRYRTVSAEFQTNQFGEDAFDSFDPYFLTTSAFTHVIVARSYNQSESEMPVPDEVYTVEIGSFSKQCLKNYDFENRQFALGTSFVNVWGSIILAVATFIGTVQAIALLICFKQRLVNSRILTVILSSVLLVCSMILEIITLLLSGIFIVTSPEETKTALALFTSLSLFSLSFFIVVFFVYMVLLVRFFYMRNVYALIQRSKKKTADELIEVLRTHRRLSAKYIVGIVIAVFVSVLLVCMAIGGGSGLNRKHPYRQYSFIYDTKRRDLVRMIVVILMFAFELAAIVYDLIMNSKALVTKGIRHYLFFDDPLLFRLEMIWVFTIPVNAVIVVILDYAIDPYNEQLRVTPQNFYALVGFLYIKIILSAVQYIVYFWTSGGGLALWLGSARVVTNWMKRCCRGKDVLDDEEEEKNLIEAFLLHGEAAKSLLEDYCTKEFSSENMMFYTAALSTFQISDMKMADNASITMEESRELNKMYIEKGAPLELNLPGKTKRAFVSAIQELDASGWDSVSWKVYKPIYAQCMANLSDTFSRFSDTADYQVFLKTVSLQTELLASNF